MINAEIFNNYSVFENSSFVIAVELGAKKKKKKLEKNKPENSSLPTVAKFGEHRFHQGIKRSQRRIH